MAEARLGQLLAAQATARLLGGLQDQDRAAGFQQRDAGRQPVRT